MYTIVIQYNFCFALLNAYNMNIYFSISIFFKMLKNNSLLWVVYGILFLWIIFVFFTTYISGSEKSIIFQYPEEEISFWWDSIPMSWVNYDNKSRFDKEFLLSSWNLYQMYLYIKRWPLYSEHILEKLKQYDIHPDLAYLPVAESALRNDVVSSAWAWWIWQFMPETWKAYWLRIDEFVDERYHFEKSTDAAMRYLSKLYEDFWDWALVAAAYNRWENGLRRDMESQWVDNYYDLYLNEETSRYVFRITAIKYAMQSYYQNKTFIDGIIGWVYEKPNIELIKVWEISDLQLWSNLNNHNYKDIKNLNKWIIWNSLQEWEWEITVLKK